MAWIKGPRCGIDNCSSRFYRVISGQRVCQNNHIQEGSETVGDDDDFVAVGRRIRQPRENKSTNPFVKKHYEHKTVRGKEARQLVWEFMQIVFREQVNFMKTKFNLDDDFEMNCRELWACFFDLHKSKNFTLTHLVCLIYLATRRSNEQVMLGDFNLWIRASHFPYLEAYRYLPKDQYSKLPSDLRKMFLPSAGLRYMSLHKSTFTLKARMSKAYPHSKFYEIDPRYVCFRLCRDFLSPPAVYEASMKLVSLVNRNPVQKEYSKMIMSEELPASYAVLAIAKFYYGYGIAQKQGIRSESRSNVNWGVWKDLMTKLWILNPESARADERLVHTWSGSQIDDYSIWYSKHLSSSDLDKRLKNIFPVPHSEVETDASYASPEVSSESCELLYSVAPSSETRIPKRSEHEILTKKPYECYTSLSEDIPEEIAVLYEVLEKFLSAEPDFFREKVHAYEGRLRRYFPKTL